MSLRIKTGRGCGANKFDFLKNVKNATRQTAQKTTSSEVEKSSIVKMSAKIRGVMGSLLFTPCPKTLECHAGSKRCNGIVQGFPAQPPHANA